MGEERKMEDGGSQEEPLQCGAQSYRLKEKEGSICTATAMSCVLRALVVSMNILCANILFNCNTHLSSL